MNNPTTRKAFTLVELLVVITIIGILVALVTVAASGAMKKARQTRIKIEIDQLSAAMEDFKLTHGAYPPNTMTDAGGVLNETQIFANFKRQLKKAFPRHREPDSLLQNLIGTGTGGALPGGMSAGESLVFWLGGFSADPKYPISGEGGPSYIGGTTSLSDPIEDRNWIIPMEITRLGPRYDEDDPNAGFFDDSAGRFLVFNDPNPNAPMGQNRRINFWQFVAPNSTQPYLYFDTSRGAPTAANDPPAATALHPNELHVHAIKVRLDFNAPPRFANEDKFQILHCGIDDEWGDFDPLALYERGPDPIAPATYNLLIYFPDGPFAGEIADTLTNFSEGTLEDSQP